ncbi:uncharacterized protein LOC126575037 isoform X1 [Anopheles aquasalis]|uniref:uncharacterized protein LOC126575037 isoform X1 n=1 Tax=Anopheles aquasalis TaxID=42839 RepID=UPI00215A57AA|nr:uncharacterized protein LOC126575037 isoform X1 [Anopheles aquasalis]
MGGMLSVLVASVGAMDLIYCLAYVSSNQPAITDGGDGGEKDADSPQQQDNAGAKDDDGGLARYRKSVQEQLDTARRSDEAIGVTYAQDGVPYRDGYRVEHFDEQRLDALGVKIRDLERRSQEKEQRLEQLNVQLHELERKSVEREQLLIAEVQRSRSVSRATTPEPTGSSVDRLSIELARDSGTPVPSIVLGDGADTRASSGSSSSSSDERRRASGGSIKFRPIRRDDELRRSVKRRSVASNASQDDRAEELLLLSQLEADEAAQMQDYVPLVYARDDEQQQQHHHHQHLGDPFGRRHKISPIQELCQMHEEEDQHQHEHEHEHEPEQWLPERSPEPTLAGTITRPWGDIKPGESKEKATIRRSARSLSIEEEEPARLSDVEVDTEPVAVQRSAPRHTSEVIADSAIEQPTLRRTTKESDLASLLAVGGEGAGSKASTTSGCTTTGGGSARNDTNTWTTEITIQTEESEDSEELFLLPDTRTTHFMQSKSPSPYVEEQDELEMEALEQQQHQQHRDHHHHDHHSVACDRDKTVDRRLTDISNRLVPLVPRSDLHLPSPSIPVDRPRSPTPYDQADQAANFRSRSSSSTSSSSAVSQLITHERRSRSRSVLSNGSVSHHEDPNVIPYHRLPSSSPLLVLEQPPEDVIAPTITRSEPNDTGIEGDTECDDDTERSTGQPAASRSRSPRLLHPSRRTPASGSCSPSPQNGSPSPSSPSSPRRKHKERKRFTRSLTPIEFDQTFMDSFTEQRLSVSPAELEDYINSMEEISFVPPKLERPAYLYPSIKSPDSIPSLVLTDEKGDDALFHDELSTMAFYGEQGMAGEGRRTPNHRVNYVEWIRKFPENQTSHLSLDDYDSDDEEVEAIIRLASTMAEEKQEPVDQSVFPVGLAGSTGVSPAQPLAIIVPIVTPEPPPAIEQRTEFPLNVPALYATPSPTGSGPLTDLSDLSSNVSPLSLPTPPPAIPTVNGSHFTPIPSPITLSVDRGGNDDDAPDLAAGVAASSPSRSPVSPLRVNLGVPSPVRMMSRSPTGSPLPADITPEELELFDIGHLDGLIFEAKSREPSPAPAMPARNPLLSPDELAFDIGNMGGLILGPPSRGSSPLPPPSPTPPSSLDAHEHDIARPGIPDNEHHRE